MLSQLRPALVALGIFTILTGLVYPLVVTGIAQVVFPWRANGSLIVHNGQPVGSALIGQPFDDPKYFWGRLSATSPAGYTAFNGDKLTGSSGSNYGPLHPALLDAVQARITALQDADPDNTAPIPVDLVTASGSGLDPHMSPAAAAYQIGRVARARGLSEQRCVSWWPSTLRAGPLAVGRTTRERPGHWPRSAMIARPSRCERNL